MGRHPIIAPGAAPADPGATTVGRGRAPRAAPTSWVVLAATTLAGPACAEHLALTYQRCDGNRVLAGAGPGGAARAVDVELPGPAAWVLAANAGGGARWLVVLEDGRIARVHVDADGGVGPARLEARRLPAGAPPAATRDLALLGRGTRASALTLIRTWTRG